MQDNQQPYQLLTGNESGNVTQHLTRSDFMINIKMTSENNNDFCPF